MQKVLVINPQNCTGCRTCETVCSLSHEQRCSPDESRIRVIKQDDGGIYIAMTCQQCEDPICEEVCPTSAIARNADTGAMLIDDTKCLGCRLCIMACPIGGPSVNIAGKVIKCDLCDGSPRCAELCKDNAIEWVSLEELGTAKRREKIKNYSDFLGMVSGGVTVEKKEPEVAWLAHRTAAKWRGWR